MNALHHFPIAAKPEATILRLSPIRDGAGRLDAVLSDRGHTVHAHRTVPQAVRALRRSEADMVLIDVAPGAADALDVIRTVRQETQAPLVAYIDQPDDVTEAVALRFGADLVLPGSVSAPLAAERLAALLRRGAGAASQTAPTRGRLVRGALRLDLDGLRATWQGKLVPLTRTEFDLLCDLAARPGHLRNRDQICTALYGHASSVFDRTVDSHVKRVRKKMRKVDPTFDRIETVYGAGYRWRPVDADG